MKVHTTLVARVLALLALTAFATPSMAQLPTASMRGVVTDSQGGVLRGATVTATHLQTGLKRSTDTNQSGEYRLGALPSGVYDIVAELSGFAGQKRRVELLLNQEAEVAFSMGIGGRAETVNVMAETPVLETTKSEVSRVFKEEQIRDLPLVDRNYLHLMLSAPGVTTGGTGAQGFGAAVNGQRSRQVNFVIDGSDNNDASVSGNRSPVIQDAVAEFRIVTTLFPAELGRNTGAIAIASTKSGTNKFRGTASEYYENAEELNARTNLEKSAGFDKPGTLRRDTYGFTFGGPLQRERMFFFGAYQRIPFEGRGAAVPIFSPTEEGRALLAAIPGADSRLLALLNQYIPLPNAGATRTTAVSGVAIPFRDYIATLPNSSTDNQAIVRVDRNLSSSDNVFGRYIYNRFLAIGASNPPGFANDVVSNTHNTVGTWNRVLGSATVNELHVSHGRTGGLVPAGSTNPPGDGELSYLVVSGFFTIGLPNGIPQDRKEQVWQFTDSLSHLRGNHGFKFGADVRRVQVTSFVPFDFRGMYIFQNLAQFVTNTPFSVTQAYGDPEPAFRYFETGFFAQDDWKVRPNVTLNLGLRYERTGAAQGFYSNVRTDNNNFAPRLGFAWDLTSNTRTVIRGGYGLTYDQFFLNIPLLAAQGPPFQRRITVFSGSPYPRVPADREIAGPELKTLNLTDIPDDTQFPMGHQWQIGMQRQIVATWRAEAAYVGSLGRNLIRRRIVNPLVCCPQEIITGPTGVPTPRRHGDPQQTGQITSLEAEAKSEYHSGQFSLEKRFSRGMSFSAAYTISRFFDDASEALGTGTPTRQLPQDNFNFGPEWSRSSFDRPHRLVFSGLYQIPFRQNQDGILGRVLGGWNLGAGYTIQSGQPFTIATGVDSNGDGDGGNDRPHVNPGGDPRTIAGYIFRPVRSGGQGNLGRNTGRGPRTNNLNAVLSKNLRLFGDHSFQMRGEFFNVLNHRQFVLRPDARERNLSVPDLFYNFSSSNGGSRTVILGVKYLF